MDALRRRPVGTMLAVLVGAFICIAGTYVFVEASGFGCESNHRD